MMENVRKFGLKYYDLPTMLWNVTVLLRVVTLNIDKRHTKRTYTKISTRFLSIDISFLEPKIAMFLNSLVAAEPVLVRVARAFEFEERIPVIFYILITMLSIVYFYVYLVSLTWFVFVRCPETGDIVAAMVMFSLGIVGEIGTSKLFCILLNIYLVKDLVEECVLCDSTVVPGSRFAKNIRKTLKIVKRRAIIFWFVIIGNGVVYAIKPIFLPGRNLLDKSFIIYGLEPIYESPHYEIAYCLEICGVIFACYLPANITALLIIITGYTEAQILALSKEITHLWADAHEYYNTNISNDGIRNKIQFKKKVVNEFIKKQLIEIVKRHTDNINLLQQIENAFRSAIAIEFMLLTIALIAELLGGLENTYIELPYTLMQVAMDCLVGQRVMDASITFENAVYGSKWENFDNANRKTILMMLRNSQKTLTLSAGGVTTLSFMSLMSVLKSVYSTYTALRSTMKRK